MLIFLILQCIICENPSLLVESTELGELSTFKELVKPQEQVRMRNLVHNIVCDEDGDHCRLSSRKHKRFSCTDCKEKERIFREVLLKKFHDEGIESVNFIQWDFNYGRQREAHEMDIKPFVDKFLEDMNLYKSHNYMTNKQFNKFENLKTQLPKGEAVIWMDYAGRLPMYL